jgi:hypothetical protein
MANISYGSTVCKKQVLILKEDKLQNHEEHIIMTANLIYEVLKTCLVSKDIDVILLDSIGDVTMAPKSLGGGEIGIMGGMV